MERADAFGLLEKKVRDLVGTRFRKPTPIQQEVIPEVIQGQNCLIISETGSGKTEACLLPLFSRWAREKPKPISILYITPLRSLNRDLLKRIIWWANKLEFEVSVRHGDTSQYERYMQAQNPCDVLISTPETLQAILTGKIMREHLSNIRYVVVDEVHELVGNKRGVQMAVGLERLRALIKSKENPQPQIIGLSATVGSPGEVAGFLTGNRPCKIVNTVKVKELEVNVECPKIKPGDMQISSEMFLAPMVVPRLKRVSELIKKKKSVLVFTNTREAAEVLSSRLRAFVPELPVDTHHSSLSKESRIQAEDGFRQENLKALVCTSSLELGIDIGSIDFIVQYMSPRQVAKFLQRVGRSGHSLKRKSSGTIIAGDADDCFESAVIAKHALEGRIEPTKIYGKSLDVLGHQIIGLALEEYMIPVSKAYEIIKESFPFRKVTKEEFLSMCEFMHRLGFIWLSEGPEGLHIKRRKRAWKYYYSNLSTIPDVKNYKIFDIVSNHPVGTLDAEFVVLHGSPGTSFICKGQAWRMLEIGNDRITVEPLQGVAGAIPAWEGELLHVPYKIAADVGKLRSEIAGEGEPEVFGNLPITENVEKNMVSHVKKQAKWGPVPTDKKMVVEYGTMEGEGTLPNQYAIFHTCWGSLINDTIGRVLSTLLMNRYGSVGLQTDPYRIVIKLPPEASSGKEALNVLKEIKPDLLKPVLEAALPNTELFRWRFLHIAKRFGIISRDADFGKGYLLKIMQTYMKSPVYREALHEIFEEKLDLENAKLIITLLQAKRIKIEVKEGLSPFGMSGLYNKHELIAQDRPEHEIFKLFKERLLNTRMRLVCCQCAWGITYPVKDLPKDVKCLKCGAKLVGVIPGYEESNEEIVKKWVKKKKLRQHELEIMNRIMDTASLVISSGPKAVVVLAGRGVGQKTAARILNKMLSGDELFREILRAEREYAKNKQFWK